MSDLMPKTEEIDEKVGVSEAMRAFLEEFGRLSYPHLRSSKAAAHALRDFVLAGMEAASSGRTTVSLPPGFREAVELMNSRAIDEAFNGIELAKLERTNRARSSGFEGVTAEGKRWVATVTDARGRAFRLTQRYLQPELAAWARYQHHLQNKIPYGKFAKEIEKQRNSLYCREGGWPEHFIRANAIWSLAVDGFPPDASFLRRGEDRWLAHGPPSDVDVERHVARIAKFYPDEYPEFVPGSAEPAPALPPPPKQAALPEASQPTIAQAQAEADKVRELAVTEAKEARAKRLAAKYGTTIETGRVSDDD
jgi:hypothetical protein